MIGAWSDASTWAPWVLLSMGIAATFFWRALGTSIAARIDPESALLQWITCVAYALLAGLIGRILIFPVGILEQTELVDRLGATVFGYVLFIALKRSIAAGTLGAAGLLMAVVWARGAGML